MRNTIFLIAAVLLLSNCKETTESNELENTVPKSMESTEQEFNAPDTPIGKIAMRAGLANWNKVEQLKFTFSFDKNGRAMYARNWTWNRRTGDVTLIATPDTVVYNRNKPMDSIQLSADQTFINDIFWVIPELKMSRDKGIKFTNPKIKQGPLTGEELNMITGVYPDTGGYTPGDAYDLYYNDDFVIKEWSYRQKNDATTGMSTTFESYLDVNGISIATDHRLEGRMARVFISNIEITKK